MTQDTRKIAVLTGDLVGSTALGPQKVEQAFAALEGCARTQAGWMGGQSLHFTRHRGDGWQVALAEPKYLLRAALAFRAALRIAGENFDSYIGIAEGEISGTLKDDLNEETAEVFSQSGDALEHAKTAGLNVRMLLSKDDEKAAALTLAEHISRGWTPAQAAAILPQLDPRDQITYTEIARRLGKSRQAVAKASEAAGIDAFTYALICFEDDND